MLYQMNKRWFSPLYTREEVLSYMKNIGGKNFQKDRNYKRVNEARQASIVALIINFLRNADQTYLRLPKHDPPDTIIMQPSSTSKGTMDISQVELTEYRGDKPLLDKLKDRKIREDYLMYSSRDLLVIELYTTIGIDYKGIYDYLEKNNVPFDVWTLRQYSIPNRDIIAEIIRIPESEKITINLSEETRKMQLRNIPDIVTSKRVGSVNKVRFEPGVSKRIAPWDSLED